MVCNLLGLVFLTQHNSSRLWHVSLVSSFLLLTSAEHAIDSFSIHSLKDLSCFQFEAILNKAAINSHIQVFV